MASSASSSSMKAVTHVKKVKVEAMSYEFLEKELSPVIQHFRYVCAYLPGTPFIGGCLSLNIYGRVSVS